MTKELPSPPSPSLPQLSCHMRCTLYAPSDRIICWPRSGFVLVITQCEDGDGDREEKSWQSYGKSIKSHCCDLSVCVALSVCLSGRILARRTVPALTTTRSQKRDTQCSQLFSGHLLHSFIYNLITDGVGIASLWWMNGQLDSWTVGQMESSCSLARHWGHTVRRKSLCPACQPASLVWRDALWAARDAVSSTLFSLIFLWPLWRLPNRRP